MPDNFAEKFKALETPALPAKLHIRLMRQVFFLKFRRAFVVIIALAVLNVGLSGWRLSVRLTETDGIALLRILLATANFSYLYLRAFLADIFTLLPIYTLMIFIINTAISIYVFLLTLAFRKVTLKSLGRVPS